MRRAITVAALLLGSWPALAQQPAPCAGAIYRQFDFWLGEWEVTAGGKVAGHNTIVRSADGCMLSEHWRSARGNEGRSLNAYDAAYGVWRQFWVGADGGVLRLSGGLRDAAMVMSGKRRQADGREQAQRITWTPRADGRVEQRWESSDDGEHWSVVFLGEYRRVDAAPVPAAPGAKHQ